MTKYLQPMHRAQLFSTLQSNGLFDCLTAAAATSHAETRVRSRSFPFCAPLENPRRCVPNGH